MEQTVVLISGANRGLGKGLLERYLAKPSHTVVALNRDPTHESSQALSALAAGSNSKLVILKCDSSLKDDPNDAIEKLKQRGVDHINLVIANAAIGFSFPYVKDIEIADLQAHLETNVFGVIRLFQAARPLLHKAKNPKWVTMGSSAGCLVNQNPVPSGTYGPSKAAIHWLTKRMDAEDPEVTAIVMDPGWVQTEMGNLGAVTYGFEKAPMEIPESVQGVQRVIDEATKETHGGRMWAHNGKEQQW